MSTDQMCDRYIAMMAEWSANARKDGAGAVARVLERAIADMRIARNYGVPGQVSKPKLVWTNPEEPKSFRRAK